jgi:hypothetical protein
VNIEALAFEPERDREDQTEAEADDECMQPQRIGVGAASGAKRARHRR